MVGKKEMKMVLDYIIKHPGANEEEIAEALNMHIVDVITTLVLLEKEGLVKPT